MTDRSFDEVADEYDRLNFFQSMVRFSSCFTELSIGELMALGGKFLELAYGEMDASDDEQESAKAIAQAVEEVIIFRLMANPDTLQKYLDAKRQHLEYLRDTTTTRQASHEEPTSTNVFKSLFGWFGKKK